MIIYQKVVQPLQICVSTEVLFQQLKDEAILLDLSSEQYIGLDSVATRIWQLISEYGDSEIVLTKMLEEYDIDGVTLRHDISAFVNELQAAGLVAVNPST